MKKLLGIVVLGLLLSGNASAITFECEMNSPYISHKIYKYIIETSDENDNEVLLFNRKENKILQRYSYKSKATLTILQNDRKYLYDGFQIRNGMSEKQFIFIEDAVVAHSVYLHLFVKDKDILNADKLYDAKSIDTGLDDFSSGICKQFS